jgi:type II secretory pathway pseudopilin PulG
LLVVVALASILLAVVFPSVGAGLGTLELRSTAQRMAAAARTAREQAVYRQTTYVLEVDGDAGRVAVAEITDGGRRQTFELPATVKVEGFVPPVQEDDGRKRSFLFFPDGGVPAMEITLGNGRRQLTVALDPLTGSAKVAE